MFCSEIATNPGDTTIFVNDFVISTDLGFAAGHEYEVLRGAPPALAGGLWPRDVSRSASDDGLRRRSTFRS
jgi:hypothetical protein